MQRFISFLVLVLLILTYSGQTPAQAKPNSAVWQPAPGTTWQWQLDGTINTGYDVTMYDIDLFDNSANTVSNLHGQGRKVICYISVGSWEDWRPDAANFPAEVIGNNYDGWAGEKWLDVGRIDLLGPIMEARLDLCASKGFDGVEPDNLDGYEANTGFNITYSEQVAYVQYIANEAHERGLSIGLKNVPEMIPDVLSYFDWALTEDCFDQGWCADMTPFIQANKAVFAAEYTDTGINFSNFCTQAQNLGLSGILKDRNLTAWMQSCAGTTAPPPAPTLLSPAHRAHTTNTLPTFTWSTVNNAQSYRFFIYNDDRSFAFKQRTFVTNYTMTTALPRQKLQWRVRTQSATTNLWGLWSNRFTLFVD
jgi:hypothetical protein